jgi:hypothetical protein
MVERSHVGDTLHYDISLLFLDQDSLVGVLEISTREAM